MNSVALPSPRVGPRLSLTLGALSVGLAAMAMLGLVNGAMSLPWAEVVGALSRGLAGTAHGNDAIVLMLRLPRVLMAALVGASLAIGGTTMQGLFRNPLVEPGLIGVSAGAALGAIAMIVLGGNLLAAWSPFARSLGVVIAAFVGALAATASVYAFGTRRPGVATLLLAGVAINAIAMAGVGLLTYLADEHQLRDLSFWSLGSLGGTSWTRLGLVAPCMLVPMLWLPRHAAALNALLLGEREACLLGYRPQALRRVLVILVAVATGAAVAMCGVIGFVGLVVPHLLRLTIGPDHRQLLPASALAGASLLIAADAVARTVAAPAELPIGVLTALLGGPFFLWLLMRQRIGEAGT